MVGTYKVDERDTVAGRLNAFNDYNSPVYKRVASMANRQAAARGLRNSTIAGGAAAGAVMDRAFDVAKTDSTNIVNAGIQSSVNETSMRNTDVNAALSRENNIRDNETSRYATDKSAGTQVEVANINARTSIANNIRDNETAVGNNVRTNETSTRNTQIQADTQLAATRMNNETSVANNVRDNATSAANNTRNNETAVTTTRMQNETQLEATRMNNETVTANNVRDNQTSRDNTKLTTDTQLAIQQQSDKSAAERLAASIDSQEAIAADDRTSREKISADTIAANRDNLLSELSSNERMTFERIAADQSLADLRASVDREGIASNERIAKDQIAAADIRAALERDNAVKIQQMSQDSQERLQNLREQAQVDADYRQEKTFAWNDLQQGIANIDINASPESQQNQFDRLMDTYQARMDFIDGGRLTSLTEQFSRDNSSLSAGDAYEIYNIARRYGYTPEQVDMMAGAPAGTTAAWIQSQDLPPLGGAPYNGPDMQPPQAPLPVMEDNPTMDTSIAERMAAR